jgi:succinate dehydrogenase / fumarate reductase cytochrome b subunit
MRRRCAPPSASESGGERNVAVRAKRTKSDYGRPYIGHEGQWSWAFHRITGVAIIFFLFAHIVDTAMIGWGPEAYDRVTEAYKNWPVHALELGLVLAVLYHSINGVKITLVDFFPSLAGHIRTVGIVTVLVFVAAAIPVVLIMGKQILDLL